MHPSTIPARLISVIEREASRPSPTWIEQLAATLLARHGSTVQAIICYGSCLGASVPEGVADFYVLVDSYHAFYSKRLPALLNRLLPPNVYYLEAPFERGSMRGKYAVMSLANFERGTSMKWFHSYLWGRFAQPATIVFARNSNIHERVVTALAQAVLTFLTRVIPDLAEIFTVEQLWRSGLLLSYGAELRAERSERAAHLFALAPAYYRAITEAAVAALPFSPITGSATTKGRYRAAFPASTRGRSRGLWRLRRTQGKLLSVLRLIKAGLTFNGGLDYLAWKIKRHSGIKIEVTPRMRRHPVFSGIGIFWRTYRRGGFR